MQLIILILGLMISLTVWADGENIDLQVKVSGDRSKPIVFMIHGSPGSLSDFKKIQSDPELNANALLVSVNRPMSQNAEFSGHPFNIKYQAKIFTDYLNKKYPGRQIILVGHSYGASIAAKMAADNSDKFSSVILISSIANPEEVKNSLKIKILKSFSTISNLKSVKWLVPEKIINTQQELAMFGDDLESLKKDWPKIQSKVIIIQGDSDKMVNPQNATFIKNLASKQEATVHLIPKGPHSLLKKNAEDVNQILFNELNIKSWRKCEQLFSKVLN